MRCTKRAFGDNVTVIRDERMKLRDGDLLVWAEAWQKRRYSASEHGFAGAGRTR